MINSNWKEQLMEVLKENVKYYEAPIRGFQVFDEGLEKIREVFVTETHEAYWQDLYHKECKRFSELLELYQTLLKQKQI